MGKKKEEKKKSIWKSEPTPLSKRTCSSGVTFRAKEVKQDEHDSD